MSDAAPPDAPTTAKARRLVRKPNLTEADHQALSRYVQKQEAQLGEQAARLMLAVALGVQLGIDDDEADAMAKRYAFGPGLDALAAEPGPPPRKCDRCSLPLHGREHATDCRMCDPLCPVWGTHGHMWDGDEERSRAAYLAADKRPLSPEPDEDIPFGEEEIDLRGCQTWSSS